MIIIQSLLLQKLQILLFIIFLHSSSPLKARITILVSIVIIGTISHSSLRFNYISPSHFTLPKYFVISIGFYYRSHLRKALKAEVVSATPSSVYKSSNPFDIAGSPVELMPLLLMVDLMFSLYFRFLRCSEL